MLLLTQNVDNLERYALLLLLQLVRAPVTHSPKETPTTQLGSRSGGAAETAALEPFQELGDGDSSDEESKQKSGEPVAARCLVHVERRLLNACEAAINTQWPSRIRRRAKAAASRGASEDAAAPDESRLYTRQSEINAVASRFPLNSDFFVLPAFLPIRELHGNAFYFRCTGEEETREEDNVALLESDPSPCASRKASTASTRRRRGSASKESADASPTERLPKREDARASEGESRQYNLRPAKKQRSAAEALSPNQECGGVAEDGCAASRKVSKEELEGAAAASHCRHHQRSPSVCPFAERAALHHSQVSWQLPKASSAAESGEPSAEALTRVVDSVWEILRRTRRNGRSRSPFAPNALPSTAALVARCPGCGSSCLPLCLLFDEGLFSAHCAFTGETFARTFLAVAGFASQPSLLAHLPSTPHLQSVVEETRREQARRRQSPLKGADSAQQQFRPSNRRVFWQGCAGGASCLCDKCCAEEEWKLRKATAPLVEIQVVQGEQRDCPTAFEETQDLIAAMAGTANLDFMGTCEETKANQLLPRDDCSSLSLASEGVSVSNALETGSSRQGSEWTSSCTGAGGGTRELQLTHRMPTAVALLLGTSLCTSSSDWLLLLLEAFGGEALAVNNGSGPLDQRFDYTAQQKQILLDAFAALQGAWTHTQPESTAVSEDLQHEKGNNPSVATASVTSPKRESSDSLGEQQARSNEKLHRELLHTLASRFEEAGSAGGEAFTCRSRRVLRLREDIEDFFRRLCPLDLQQWLDRHASALREAHFYALTQLCKAPGKSRRKTCPLPHHGD